MVSLKHTSAVDTGVDAPFAATSSTGIPEQSIPQVRLSDTDVKLYRALTREVVENTLEKEVVFRYKEGERLDPKRWKFVKAKERMRVYKRVAMSDEELSPMVLGVGFIEGTIENALYGLHHKTTTEMRTTSAYINPNILDTAVLANLELGTDADPFRYLGLKWRVAQTPGGSIIKNRDVCTLESMGVATDAQGVKYGYQVIKSVDVPSFPVFPAITATATVVPIDAAVTATATTTVAPAATNTNTVVRAQMLLCCIFRQVEPSVVAFYSKGVFDLKGDLPAFLAYSTSADMVLSISKSVDCAMAKRLTMMVLQSERSSGDSAYSHRNVRRRNLVKSSKDVFKNASCEVCARYPSSLSASCRSCKICSAAVCKKCYVKAHVLATPHNVRVVCCISCVVKSREFRVDPREPYPLIELNEEECRR